MDYIEITEKIAEYTKAHVKEKRFAHSERVAKMCQSLCEKYGLDPLKGYLAGIGHDMCKDMPAEELIETSKRYEAPTDFELQKPSLLHGKAAAVMMQENFGITDKDIIEAVAVHVSGKSGMCDLAKCLFISDKAEPGRPQSTDEYRKRFETMTLDQVLYTVLKENYDYIKAKGYVVYPGTLQMIEELNGKWGK